MKDKTEYSIFNRRYLGSKYQLLDTIARVVHEQCAPINSFADLFSGTGVVSTLFPHCRIITNDILYSNYICNYAWFGPLNYRRKKVSSLIQYYNSVALDEDNYVSNIFGGKYFSIADGKRIGFIREDIEQRFKEGEINERERAVLITSLLYSIDRIANTCGHYDAYIQGQELRDVLTLLPLNAKSRNRKSNLCFNEDVITVSKKMSADLVYLDPPYNSRQYSDSYHLLENIARWEKPEVYGVACKMDRTALKSAFCTNKAPVVMNELIMSLNCKYILLSYNNMAKKGNARSNARISDDEIVESLSRRGELMIFTQDHKAFSAGKSSIKNNQERLFLCKVR